MQILYAETSLWNELCDQAIDAKMVAEALARQGAQLALGMNVVFEMVKTFGSSGQQARDRAHHLFSYLKTWVRDDFPVTRQTPEFLAFDLAVRMERRFAVAPALVRPNVFVNGELCHRNPRRSNSN